MAVTNIGLRDSAKALADMVNDQFVPDPTWTTWANEGVEKLWKFVTALYPDLFHTTFDFTLAGSGVGAGINQQAVPVGFRELRGVSKDPDNPTLRASLRRWNFNERDDTNAGVSTVAGTYRLYYVQGPAVLAADGDPIDVALEPWREFIELTMAIKARTKEQSDTSDLRANLTELRAEIEDEAAGRDKGEPETIGDVENPYRSVNAWWWAGPMRVPTYRLLGQNIVLR